MTHQHRLTEIGKVNASIERHVYRCTQCSHTTTIKTRSTVNLVPLRDTSDNDQTLTFGDIARLMTTARS